MKKIKPCPFCGGNADLEEGGYYVECLDYKGCGAYGPTGYHDSEAIEKWNSAPRKDAGAVDLINEMQDLIKQAGLVRVHPSRAK